MFFLNPLEEMEIEPDLAFLERMPNALSTIELLKRRKERVAALADLYERQYWLLADELCVRAQDGENPSPNGDEAADRKEYESVADYFRADGKGVTATGNEDKQGERCGFVPDFASVEEAINSGKISLGDKDAAEKRIGARKANASENLASAVDLEKTAMSLFSR